MQVESIEATAYQISKDLNADYRVVSKKLQEFLDNEVVEVIGQSANSHKANIYKISPFVYEKLTSLLQANKSKFASGASADIMRDLGAMKHLQMKVDEQVETIKSLNELISSQDKQIQDLKNINVQIDADLKIAKSEQKLLTDKSATFEAENARLNQELGKVSKQVQTRNIWLFALSAILLVLVVVTICYFTMAK